MSNISSRPYIGTWRMDNHKVVAHTPDALVYINGDVTIPGCATCNEKIDLQKYITQVTVDAGVDPGAASANFTLSIPSHSTDSFVRDGQFILHPGLEVHIYMRGYFPVAGMYADLNAGAAGNTYLSQVGMSSTDLQNLLAYPYYHVFHGIVTSVSNSWAPAQNSITIHCGSMLNFWQYQISNENASVLGNRAQNSKADSSVVGNNYTGMHPYEIIYSLWQDIGNQQGGVGFFLEEATNQNAKIGDPKNTVFSFIQKYWQQRFGQRMAKLRMHGLDGRLFNTVQAAFLGTLSSDHITAALPILSALGEPDRFQKILASDPVRQTRILDQWRKAFPGNGTITAGIVQSQQGSAITLGLNVSQMIAFANDINQWGAGLSLFESTYETKLEIAEKVCNITGFEFYQDVDGDFVFKPPMYNLDTSTSRAYRMEEIDIISLNFEEKEPQATYYELHVGQFGELQVAGLDGAMGKRALYIDYRLVAQFGWRGALASNAYLTDPRALFFTAVNRLDIMNVPCKSATITIPERPELRPGYPVYIPYLDCFYYCPSFVHTHSVGGQCTTTLSLVGKRAKFYAPGDPNKAKSGIGAIDLSATTLPQLPLQVTDSDGQRRLSGFPNVVMALDPNSLDPTFFSTKKGIYPTDNQSIYNLLRYAVQKGVLSTPDPVNPGPLYWMQTAEQTYKVFQFNLNVPGTTGADQTSYDAIRKTFGIPGTATTVNLNSINSNSAQQDQSRKETAAAFASQISDLQSQLATAQTTLDQMQNSSMTSGGDATDQAATVAGLQAQITLLDAQASAAALPTANQNPALADLTNLILQVRGAAVTDTSWKAKDLNRTASLLDLLGNKKASMTTGDVPGDFRYYSASHPVATMQGQPIMKIDKRKNTYALQNPVLQAGAADTILMYSPNVTAPAGGTAPSAALVANKPTWGLNILANDLKTGVITPTNRIQELSFSVHTLLAAKATQSTASGSHTPTPSNELRVAMRHIFVPFGKNAAKTDVPFDGTNPCVFTKPITDFGNLLQQASQAAQAAFESNLAIGNITSLPSGPSFPSDLTTLWNNLPVPGRLKINCKTGGINPQTDLSMIGTLATDSINIASVTGGSQVVIGPNSGFGARVPPTGEATSLHQGTDIPGAKSFVPFNNDGSSVTGKVTYISSFSPKNGITVIVTTSSGVQLHFGDLGSVRVHYGDRVASGTQIGINATSAQISNITGAHSHFAINAGNGPENAQDVDLCGNYTLQGLWEQIASSIANWLFDYYLGHSVSNWMASSKLTTAQQNVVLTVYFNVFNSFYGAPTVPQSSPTVAQEATSSHVLKTPVFPVSDAGGYEVIGSYRYGRGLDINPDGVWSTLQTQDPLYGIQIKDASGTFLTADIIETATAQYVGTVRTPAVSGKVAQAGQNLLASLQKQDPTQTDILSLPQGTSSDPAVLQWALRNWIADKYKDANMKIPLVNAGFAMTDLTVPTGRICSCRYAEADVLLNMAGQQSFVPMANGQPPGVALPASADRITKWIASAAMQATAQWAAGRRAMQGAIPNQAPQSVVTAVVNAAEEWQNTASVLNQRAQTIAATASGLPNNFQGGNGS